MCRALSVHAEQCCICCTAGGAPNSVIPAFQNHPSGCHEVATMNVTRY